MYRNTGWGAHGLILLAWLSALLTLAAQTSSASGHNLDHNYEKTIESQTQYVLKRVRRHSYHKHGVGASPVAFTREKVAEAGDQVCIVVTTFNVEPFVGQCLSSLLGQTHANLEVIVVDDASTDGTVAEARAVIGGDPRARVVSLASNTPGGTGTPANSGLSMCESPWVIFFDGDDWASTQFVAELVAMAEADALEVRTRVSCVTCLCRIML